MLLTALESHYFSVVNEARQRRRVRRRYARLAPIYNLSTPRSNPCLQEGGD
jgi:hypothetical protein